MSEQPGNGPEESPLDRLVREAKQDLQPRVSDPQWDAMEARLLARMAEEKSPLVEDVHAPLGRARFLRLGGFALAAAAAALVFVRSDPSSTLAPSPLAAQTELSAGSLRESVGAGEVRVGGLSASAGHVLRAGDIIEADGARGMLERPRKVTWLIERDGAEGASPAVARVRVKSAGEALVLGLEQGAIEAQVTPVPSGEAFAVDIATDTTLVRVAVHGTHLRVARNGTRVVVDLTEGVVSIGAPPRAGSTYGTLVTAPSHVEFDATNLEGTLRVEHAPASVRTAVPLVSRDAPLTTRNEAADAPARRPASAGESAVRPSLTDRAERVALPEASRLDTAAKPDPTKAALPPRAAIAAAVRECAAARSRPENVRVTVTSSLKLKVGARGDVETAQFDPPLLPEIQTCAAAEIYKVRVEDAASSSVVIPIQFSY